MYCHNKVPILQNGPVTVLSQCRSYTTNRSSYCVVKVHFLYYKTVLLLYCHISNLILLNFPVTILSNCISYNTKWSSYSIFTVQFLCHKFSSYCIVTLQFSNYKRSSYSIVIIISLYYISVQLLYCHNTFPILQNDPVTELSQCRNYTRKRYSYCIVKIYFL